jgi:glutathione peroxidase-family protein
VPKLYYVTNLLEEMIKFYGKRRIKENFTTFLIVWKKQKVSRYFPSTTMENDGSVSGKSENKIPYFLRSWKMGGTETISGPCL